MPFDQMSDVSHRLQTAVGRPPEPAVPERFGLFQGRSMPESPKFLLHGPGPTHLQIQGTKGFKAISLELGQVFLRVQPQIFGAFQLRSPSLPGFPEPLSWTTSLYLDMHHLQAEFQIIPLLRDPLYPREKWGVSSVFCQAGALEPPQPNIQF